MSEDRTPAAGGAVIGPAVGGAVIGPAAGGAIIGIDVGGTFTDVFHLDEATGTRRVAKVSSNRSRESVGFLNGVASALAAVPRGTQPIAAGLGDAGLDSVAAIIHGTTVGTNALLERSGARAGLITTAGFADVLEMRRRDRPRTWGLWGEFHPVVPRDLRLEIDERTGADGEVLTAVDPGEVERVAKQLLDMGCESVCVALLNSYVNDTNERTVAETLNRVWPNEHVSISSSILREIREFERTSTTALNAYLQPVVGNYLRELEDGLDDAGFGGRFMIVQSNGGVMSSTEARRVPIRTALSGPAAGVIASAHIAGAAGFGDVITCDMGGTSFDVAVISGGETVLTDQTTIDFGMVVRSPMIEITTIGAGGGSIAWIDRSGILRIGPESAGSVPGPVCYGAGNDRPTVTDANVVLGRINAESPIGGVLDRLDVAAAEAALLHHVGEPLGLDAHGAAEAVLRVATSAMAGAIRLVSIERGHDPTRFRAMPFGGAGALFTCGFIGEVGLQGAIIPPVPGVTSAMGCVIADARHDEVRTVNTLLDNLDMDGLSASVASDTATGRELIEGSGIAFDRVERRIELDASYVGQTHTVPVPVAIDDTTTRDDLRDAFESAYRRSYGRLLDGLAIRVLTVRTAVIGTRPKFDLHLLSPAPDASMNTALQGSRRVYFDGRFHDTRVLSRLDLPAGAVIDGPAVLEQPDATIVIEPGYRAFVDELGNLLVDPVDPS